MFNRKDLPVTSVHMNFRYPALVRNAQVEGPDEASILSFQLRGGDFRCSQRARQHGSRYETTSSKVTVSSADSILDPPNAFEFPGGVPATSFSTE
jgi:hypothetical protein